MANTNINLTDIHQAIIDALKDRFPKVTIASYDPSENLESLAPACLLNIEELPKAPDVGDGRYPVLAQFAIHCVLGGKSTTCKWNSKSSLWPCRSSSMKRVFG